MAWENVVLVMYALKEKKKSSTKNARIEFSFRLFRRYKVNMIN